MIPVPGGAILLNCRRVTALSWPQRVATPYGELSTQLLVNGKAWRMLDRSWLEQIYNYMDDIAPPTIVLRFEISDAFNAIWKEIGDLTGVYNWARSSLWNSSSACPSTEIERVSDKIVECDVTPQVSGFGVTGANPIKSPRSPSYMTDSDGGALSYSDLPNYGDVVQFPATEHFVLASTAGVTSQVVADADGTYSLQIDGVFTEVASGHGSGDTIGWGYLAQTDVDNDYMEAIHLDFVAPSADPSGNQVEIFPITSSLYSPFLDFTDVTGSDSDMVDGLAASFTPGMSWSGASTIDGGDTLTLEFPPGYAPYNSARTITPYADIMDVTRPDRSNPYLSPYDSDLHYGFVYAGGRPLTFRDPRDGSIIGTLADPEASIPSWDGYNFVQVGNSPDVYVSWASGGAASGSDLIIVVLDPSFPTSLYMQTSRPDIEV